MIKVDNILFQKLRMSDKEGSGSDGSLEEEAYEVEEIREKMRGDDGDWLYYVKVCWLVCIKWL